MGPRLLIVDAFTDSPFAGNAAAVCLLDGPAPEDWMAAVAREMNLSETAFVHREGDHFRLRWFTPAKEVDLCGHATLASAHALWAEGALRPGDAAEFETRSGRLTCRRTPQGIAMDFPANRGSPAPAPPGLWTALGMTPVDIVLRNRMDHLMVVTDEAAVRAMRPDFPALSRLSGVHGFIVTAPSRDPAFDYVCRYFVPAYGIDEDPVTGSIQTMLGPYWCDRLGKSEVRVHQASRRGGAMLVRPDGDRVALTGTAVTTVKGNLAAAPPHIAPVPTMA
ncbi:MAG: PhzF family phenazine biosynthesis protein [Thermoplasmatota archaeon]